MLSSSFLDIAIGIVFVFLLLSVIATAINEIVASVASMRGKNLLLGLQTLLNDTPTNVNGLASNVYNHGQIFGLYVGNFDPAKPRNLPSYIPTKNFVMALLDVVPEAAAALPPPDPVPADVQGAQQAVQQAAQTAQEAAQAAARLLTQVPPPTPDQVAVAKENAVAAAARARLLTLRLDAVKLANYNLTRKVGVPLLSMIDSAANDMDTLRSHVEDWYNGAMDRVSGRYRYNTQLNLLIIGVGLALALNADIVNIAQQLSKNPTLRESIVATAQSYQASKAGQTTPNQTTSEQTAPDQANNSAPAGTPQNRTNPAQGTNPDLAKQLGNVSDQINRVQGLGIPLGWPVPPSQRRPPLGWLSPILGWLLTAIAVSLGAPFWFDMLNKIMVVRSTIKPGEKSQPGRPKDKEKK